jgi:predicted metal-dependent hydrolase
MMQGLLRFTLDLFESAPATPAVHPAGLDSPPDSVPKVTTAHTERAQPAIEKVAYDAPAASPLTPQTLQQALAPATFSHPRATRQALLNGVTVGYAFRRGKRRSIGFSVCADGLAVSAPKWVPLHEIDKAVLEKSLWIIEKLQETRARHARLEAARIDWKDGATLPFLGQPLTLVLDSRPDGTAVNHPKGPQASANARLQTDADARDLPGAPRQTLRISLPHDATPERIRDAAQAWLMRQARQIFTERLDHFAPLLGVQWRRLSLSSAATRWGSASADGAIRLNWRLVHFRLSVLDYVVAHELSHLRVMDHSPRFWDTVREVAPDYAHLRRQLKDEAIPRW